MAPCRTCPCSRSRAHRAPTSSSTASNSASFSSSVSVGPSPVVPASTSPSEPCSTRWRARAREASRSSEPSAANGVAIAVQMRPAGGSARLVAAQDSRCDHSRGQAPARQERLEPDREARRQLAHAAHREQHARREGLARGRVVADREQLALCRRAASPGARRGPAGARSGSARRARSRRGCARPWPPRCPTARRACGAECSSTISTCGKSARPARRTASRARRRARSWARRTTGSSAARAAASRRSRAAASRPVVPSTTATPLASAASSVLLAELGPGEVDERRPPAPRRAPRRPSR